jgi:segregation and condensation protein B
VLQTLMERGLVKISGRAEVPGRPLLYETTQFFLDHFGLRTLDELPNVEELRTRHLPVARSVAGNGDAGPSQSSTPSN